MRFGAGFKEAGFAWMLPGSTGNGVILRWGMFVLFVSWKIEAVTDKEGAITDICDDTRIAGLCVCECVDWNSR